MQDEDSIEEVFDNEDKKEDTCNRNPVIECVVVLRRIWFQTQRRKNHARQG